MDGIDDSTQEDNNKEVVFRCQFILLYSHFDWIVVVMALLIYRGFNFYSL